MTDDLEALQLMKQSDVLRLLSVSRTRLYELRRHGNFPEPVYLMGDRNLMRFKKAEVLAWKEANSHAAPVAPAPLDRRRRAAAEPARA